MGKVLSFQKLIAPYEKKGYGLAKKGRTKFAEWRLLKKNRGFLGITVDSVFIYLLDGDIEREHINDFCKKYVDIYESEGLLGGDKEVILAYSGSLDKKEYPKIVKNVFEKKGIDSKISSKNLQPRKPQLKKERVVSKVPQKPITQKTQRSSVKPSRKLSVTSIRNEINKWKKVAPKVSGRGRERLMTTSMVGYLSSKYPNILTEEKLGHTRIDAIIGKIGLEAKYRPNQNEINRLYGQTEEYQRYLDHIIIVFFDTNQAYINSFRRKIRSSKFENKVTILNI